MSSLPPKKLLLDACVATLHSRATEAQRAMADAQRAANEYGQPRDRYDSFRAQVLSRRDMYARQYDEARKLLESLKRINPDLVCQKVEVGAVVQTNEQILFVSVGIGKMNAEGIDFVAISPQVPVFDAIKGLKAGDKYRFRGVDFEVIEVK